MVSGLDLVVDDTSNLATANNCWDMDSMVEANVDANHLSMLRQRAHLLYSMVHYHWQLELAPVTVTITVSQVLDLHAVAMFVVAWLTIPLISM